MLFKLVMHGTNFPWQTATPKTMLWLHPRNLIADKTFLNTILAFFSSTFGVVVCFKDEFGFIWCDDWSASCERIRVWTMLATANTVLYTIYTTRSCSVVFKGAFRKIFFKRVSKLMLVILSGNVKSDWDGTILTVDGYLGYLWCQNSWTKSGQISSCQ